MSDEIRQPLLRGVAEFRSLFEYQYPASRQADVPSVMQIGAFRNLHPSLPLERQTWIGRQKILKDRKGRKSTMQSLLVL